jgi:hypothetical protein
LVALDLTGVSGAYGVAESVKCIASRRDAISLVVSVLFLVGCGEDDPKSTPPISQHAVWRVGARKHERPFSTIREGTVTLRPTNATLRIPQNWLDLHKEGWRNLFVTPEELDNAAVSNAPWDECFSSLCNAAFPHDRCALHAGGDHWIGNPVSTSDVQLRVYDLSEDIDRVIARLVEEGRNDFRRWNGLSGEPVIAERKLGKWHNVLFFFGRTYWTAFGGTKGNGLIDVRIRQFSNHTIVIAAMYLRQCDDASVVDDVANSLEWPEDKLE